MKPLIERMEKKGAPKSWVAGVNKLNLEIKKLKELNKEYLNVIDLLACEKELLTKNVEDGRYAHSVIRECHRELEEENEGLNKRIARVEAERTLLTLELNRETDEPIAEIAERITRDGLVFSDALLTGGDDD